MAIREEYKLLPEEEEIHNNAEHCYVCEKKFGRPARSLPYNSHMIMQEIGAMECKDEIEPIPYNMEKYMAFKLGSLRFINGMQFMKSGLNKLASNLSAKKCKVQDCADPNHLWRIDKNRCFAYPEKFKITKNHAPVEILEIFIKKGVYPYEYMDSCSPPKNAFYSKLNNTHISDSEYEYVQYVWEKARCNTMRDYYNIYLKTDIFLLALNMYMMVEEGLRGGISMVSRRYAHANNSGIGEGKWNINKLKSFLLYLDANNLYGWAMMQYLPTENDIPEDYILKVKLAYP
ncbi:hypothetical protein RhiirC2_786840 [Rhizophagus irregularis]|uniref:DNA-directed DNA polymerase n=1 Tax=Rhizophagus irregularis TaxID=588596 RepID=A0A2N1MTI6_9GLOM|nr:hypothetical protein RhiirC2_786840 [Rhizophagus irregularis]